MENFDIDAQAEEKEVGANIQPAQLQQHAQQAGNRLQELQGIGVGPIPLRRIFDLLIEVKSGPRTRAMERFHLLVNSQEENWRILKERIRQKFESENLDEKFDYDLDDARNISLRPATRATIAEFVQIRPDDIMGQFAEIYERIQRNGRLPRNWQFMMLINVTARRRSTVRLRVNDDMINSAAAEVARFSQNHGRNFGPVESAYLSRNIARRGGGEDAIAEVINNPTPMHNVIRRFDEMPRLNSNIVRERDGNDYNEGEEDTIDIPVQFMLRIPRASFLNQLGLPNYPLVRSFDRPIPEDVVAAEQLENQEDVDHMDGL
jgi:hypothetical protein